MPRPSRHLDRALLAAGRALLPLHGLSGLTIRQVANLAGVNIGMFHYHFRTRDAFLRAVLQGVYEEMYSQLPMKLSDDKSWTGNLRTALGVVGRFVLENQALLVRVLADALAGNTVARDFLRENFPRHLRLIVGLVAAGQEAGEFRTIAPIQAVAFCAGAVGMPMLVGGALAEGNAIDAAFGQELRSTVLTAEALDERIDLALAALAIPGPRVWLGRGEGP